MKKGFSKPVDINGLEIKDLSKWKNANPKKIFFDSKFEWNCYKAFERENFNFEFHPATREVVPGCTAWALSKGAVKKIFKSTVRPITYTPDFAIYCNNGITIFVEAKGFFMKDARMRYKLFQASLASNEISIIVFDKISKINKDNLADVKALIKIIKEKFDGSSLSINKQEKNKTTLKSI